MMKIDHLRTLEVVGRGGETELQVVEKWNYFIYSVLRVELIQQRMDILYKAT